MQEKRMLSVTQLNEYLKMLLDGDRVLSSVWVRGEISNFKLYSSGHAYFTIKDEGGQLRSVMYRSYASRLAFLPEDGMRVIAHGRVSVYEVSGQYQLYVDELQPDGVGALAMRFEQLKRKLNAEGLFDEQRKKPLPDIPWRVGVITSPSGAAVHDIQNVLKRRFPAAEMILFPSAVQGVEAPMQLIAGVEFFGTTRLADVIILGRGGGSAEDLWAFNDEMLARAVAACPVPIISAVGHESDFTICDFVADRRAPTPSAAAELAVPDAAELLLFLKGTERRMHMLMENRLMQESRLLNQIAQSRVILDPMRLLERFSVKLSESEIALEKTMAQSLSEHRRRIADSAGRLEALSPLAVLARGYAAVSSDQKTVTSVNDLNIDDPIDVRFADGCVRAVVRERKE